jgi:hypothetical protein
MRKAVISWFCLLIGILLISVACKQTTKKESLFSVLDAKATGISFANTLTPASGFNLFSYMYYYNGAGVGAADFNNDGRIDLFFAANRKPGAMYLNEGNMRFKDVSAKTGIPSDSSWSTGVSVVDINTDGLTDIYICRVGNYKILKGKNSLFVCTGIDSDGIPHYEDRAAAYGIDFSGYGTQAAFFDYDLDGDLDLFLLNHSVNHEGNYAPRSLFLNTYDSLAGHRMYRNDMIQDTDGNFRGKFTDVTRISGIHSSKIGYGLGVAVSDINLDGWPDLYVGNDFHENDYLYINQKNGSFSDKGPSQLRHSSQFSMGVDIADINNDAFPEIISMDMLPNDPYMIRRSLAEDDYNIFTQKIVYGYTYQYARNNLQYNRGNGIFTEVGQYAGIHATDWSWASLWMDFNNDGWKDLFVSNGIPKRMNDIDYINFVSGEEVQRKLVNNDLQDKDLALLQKFPEIKLPNQFFLNKGGFQFSNLTDSLGINPPTFSNGAVYADLDNDGDLDIVVNNINDPVLIYRNNTSSETNKSVAATIHLAGPKTNPKAIGTRIFIFNRDKIQSYENHSVHGFLSSMHGPMLLGMMEKKIDSCFLVWPDNSAQRINLRWGLADTINWKKGLPLFDFGILKKGSRLSDGPGFVDITSASGIIWKHQENRYNEFDREPLIPHMNSTEGPALAVADINGDGLEDFFVGSSKTFHPGVFVQDSMGKFRQIPQPAMHLDSMWEAVDAIWKDVNMDGLPDLLIGTGGNEYYGRDVHMKPLLYLNDGTGKLRKKEDAFGDLYLIQSCILSDDYNGDGYPDIFLGGRVEPWQYGKPPRSYILQNDGKGRFTDVTASYSKDIVTPGMVSHAAYEDMNGDGKKDFVLSYLWGGIDLFLRKGKGFEKTILTDKKGWWQQILTADLDGDGDQDLVAGNFGLNSRLKASPDKPVRLYVQDFDDNGRVEQVMTYYVGSEEIPFAGKLQLEKSIPQLKKKFLYAADFAKADLADILGKQKLESALTLYADCFESMIFINERSDGFKPVKLPDEVQFSTQRAGIILDANRDGKIDLLLAGNNHQNNVEIGRMDGDFGSLLINDGKGNFAVADAHSTGFVGEVRKIRPIKYTNSITYLLAKNNDSLRLTRLR